MTNIELQRRLQNYPKYAEVLVLGPTLDFFKVETGVWPGKVAGDIKSVIIQTQGLMLPDRIAGKLVRSYGHE